jgi:hypothetical protein
MHLKSTAGCQISTLIFGFGKGTLYIFHEKLPKDGNVLCHSGFRSKVCYGIFIETPLHNFFLNIKIDI